MRGSRPTNQPEYTLCPPHPPCHLPAFAVNAYRKRTADPNGLPMYDFGAHHTAGMMAMPSGDVPNLPAKSGTGMRLR